MRLRNIIHKKAQLKLENIPFLILYLMITVTAVVMMGTKAYTIIGSQLKLNNFPYYQLDSRIVSRLSVQGNTGTFVVDMDKFNEDYLMRVINRDHFGEQLKDKMGIELILIKSKTGDSQIIYYNKESYERLEPIAKFRFALLNKVHPCYLVVNGAEEECILKVNIIASKI